MVAMMIVGLAACAKGTQVNAPAVGGGPTAAENPTVVQGNTITSGTRLIVQTDQPLGSDNAHVGQSYTAHVVHPVVDGSGQTIIPAGSEIVGRVAELRMGGLNSPAAINLTVDKLQVRGSEHPISAHIAATDVNASHRGVDLTYLLGGGVGGGELGAILGGTTGAPAGTASGAGAGTLISLGTTGREARLPAGTALAVQLDQPLAVRPLLPPGGWPRPFEQP
jgi:hypothetical protein